jgi:hypothetical protein
VPTTALAPVVQISTLNPDVPNGHGLLHANPKSQPAKNLNNPPN